MQYKTCDRCGATITSYQMSRFNTDELCHSCIHIESFHPLYELARKAEHHQMTLGNMNYEGVGLPTNLRLKGSKLVVVQDLKTKEFLAKMPLDNKDERCFVMEIPEMEDISDGCTCQPARRRFAMSYDWDTSKVFFNCISCNAMKVVVRLKQPFVVEHYVMRRCQAYPKVGQEIYQEDAKKVVSEWSLYGW